MKKYISKVVLLLICTYVTQMLDPGFFRKNSVYAESKNGKKKTKPTTNTEKEKFSIVTIMVPECEIVPNNHDQENNEGCSAEMMEEIEDEEKDPLGAKDPRENTRFVKKKSRSHIRKIL